MDDQVREPQSAARCPMSSGTLGNTDARTAATGAAARCPVQHGSAEAAAFDAFEGPYQVDPAAALRWFRDREPVFFSPKLGYWVVSRYEDVKAVFRDTGSFSPSIALEKVTPNTEAANAILARHGYAMNRTLVNEDEPAHMERRRALLHSFLPDELTHHEPMVRRLVKSYVDRFIDTGAADLVDEMLWEIPLTVALHFLGVPEDDMDALRRYSIAHTVNTWGRPTPEEQLAVADAVGNFWSYAGKVLERMRAAPDGHGWMEYAIRKQKEMPDVVTDSYLHSMMMAGIVAAHETTAHATANALRILLENREAWDEICADPALIPNAVEECLRLSGSIIAWRRLATRDTRVGAIDIPAGAKLLVVMASANHDARHFEDPDVLDIHRDNATDHLSFGYGSHQCMGKNLARMEMRIFLEELTRRLPHMELVPDQEFDYLPNTSFRGPDHLLVRWDPALNPERTQAAARRPRAAFPIGAPGRQSISRPMQVTAVTPLTDDILLFTLADPRGRPLPEWSAGAHVDLIVGDIQRKYSLCGDPDDRTRYQIAVKREDAGRGGSRFLHTHVKPGDRVRIRGPKNHFRLTESPDPVLLIAGGIGITPILAMADRLKRQGRPYGVHYAGRARAAMAFVDRLTRDHAGHVRLYPGDAGARLDLAAVLAAAPDAQVHACGPERLLDALAILMADRPGQLHVEHFAPVDGTLDPAVETPFEVELTDSGLSLTVPADQTLLQVLRATGIDVPSDCEEGLCGSCEVAVVSGSVDHRDKVLSAAERAEGKRMMTCCSRACGRLAIAL